MLTLAGLSLMVLGSFVALLSPADPTFDDQSESRCDRCLGCVLRHGHDRAITAAMPEPLQVRVSWLAPPSPRELPLDPFASQIDHPPLATS